LGKFEGVTTTYSLKKEGNGVYAFILSGKVTIDGQETRDGLGIWDVNALAIEANKTQSFIDGNTNAILILLWLKL
jgi:redox-sensitive bicupin YhaK (pirin superfamily)